jgi:hypothetical protein
LQVGNHLLHQFELLLGFILCRMVMGLQGVEPGSERIGQFFLLGSYRIARLNM